MPEMTGLELLKYLKANSETISAPFIIMFSSLVAQGSSAAIEALNYGAADIIKKPDGQISENLEFLKKEFEFKINGLYQGRSEVRMPFVPGPVPEVLAPEITEPGFIPAVMGIENLGPVLDKKPVRPELIAMASSTGGPPAIRTIFENLDNLSIPVVIAQHMPQGFTLEFAKNLSAIFNREVLEASPNVELKGGVIYICPGGVHSKIRKMGRDLFYQPDYSNYEGLFFKPSIDIFFRSVIESVGKNAVGIILSGMGKDGSIESVNLRKEGAFMIAQDQDSSAIWGMPGSSVKSGGIDIILDIKDIARAVNIIASGSR